MKEADFNKALEDEMLEFMENFGIPEDKAFVLFAAVTLLGIDAETASDYVLIGGKNDLGLDFAYVNQPEQRVVLMQGKQSEMISRGDIRSLCDLPEVLKNPRGIRKREGNDRVREFAKEYRRAITKGFECDIYLVHLGRLSMALKGELGPVKDCDAAHLQKAWEDLRAIQMPKRPESIQLHLKSDRMFRMPDAPERPRCVVCEIALTELYRLYENHGSGLFDDNVRLHAGDATPANKGMRQTLLDPDRQKAPDFFYYNNGIAILCEKIGKEERGKGPQQIILPLTAPQIINGAQTTYTVGNLDEDQVHRDASVLARIVCPPKKHAEQFRDNVIRFNNTQTPVKSRDFRANDAIQKALFEALSKWNPAYFYERKLGLWEALDPRHQARFRKPDAKGRTKRNFRIVDNELMAQCRLAWDKRPGTAKNDKRLIFVPVIDNGLYEEVFPEGCDAEKEVEVYLLAYDLNEMLARRRKDWGRQVKEANDEGAEEKVKGLERDRFITHFNFFALAAIRYILEVHFKEKDYSKAYKNLRNPKTFDEMYKFLKIVFGATLRAAQKGAANAGQSLNFNNWFKRDSNFEDICPEIDSMFVELKKDELQKVLLT